MTKSELKERDLSPRLRATMMKPTDPECPCDSMGTSRCREDSRNSGMLQQTPGRCGGHPTGPLVQHQPSENSGKVPAASCQGLLFTEGLSPLLQEEKHKRMQPSGDLRSVAVNSVMKGQSRANLASSMALGRGARSVMLHLASVFASHMKVECCLLLPEL